MISLELITILEEMLMELSTSRLEVCLVPSGWEEDEQNGNLIRAVTDTNPKWYQDFCAKYPDTRPAGANKKKPRTKIKRKDTLRLLNTLITTGCSASVYADDILDEARRRAELYNDWSNAESNYMPF